MYATAGAWTPSDHFALWQLVAAVLGFGIAIWQLVRTANATEASAKAITKRFLSNDLLLSLPELHKLEDALNAAVTAREPEKVSAVLVEYHRSAWAIIGNLRTDEKLKDHEVAKALEIAAKAASAAKGLIQDGSTEPLSDIVSAFRKKATATSAGIADLTARLQRGVEK